MSEGEQRIAIAESVGWTRCHKGCEGKTWRLPDNSGCQENLPDHLHDLNAMQTVETQIIKLGYTAIRTYEDLLQKQVANIVFATAAQRAEAFLKTLGLWKP